MNSKRIRQLLDSPDVRKMLGMNKTQRLLAIVSTSLILFASVYGCTVDRQQKPDVVYQPVEVPILEQPGTMQQRLQQQQQYQQLITMQQQRQQQGYQQYRQQVQQYQQQQQLEYQQYRQQRQAQYVQPVEGARMVDQSGQEWYYRMGRWWKVVLR